MPNVKSAQKRMRQNTKRRARNRAAKSAMKSTVKRARTAPEDPEKVREAMSSIARTAKRGVIHRRKAARLASRLQRRVNAAAKAGAGE